MQKANEGRKEVAKYYCPKCGYEEQTNMLSEKRCPYCVPVERMLLSFYERIIKE